jgi:aspartate ammonia-lyase
MPGKVNPVLAEMLNMAMFHVQGCDLAVALACQAGQLELNVMMPVMMLMIKIAHFFAIIFMIPSSGHRQIWRLLFSIVTIIL